MQDSFFLLYTKKLQLGSYTIKLCFQHLGQIVTLVRSLYQKQLCAIIQSIFGPLQNPRSLARGRILKAQSFSITVMQKLQNNSSNFPAIYRKRLKVPYHMSTKFVTFKLFFNKSRILFRNLFSTTTFSSTDWIKEKETLCQFP